MMTTFSIIIGLGLGVSLVASCRSNKIYILGQKCLDVILMENILALLEDSDERFEPENLLPNWLESFFLIPLAFFVPVENYFPPEEFLNKKYSREDINRVVAALSPHMKDSLKLSKRLMKREGPSHVRRTKKPCLRIVK